MPETKSFEERLQEIESAIARLDSGSDPATCAAAKALVQSLMDMHGAAIRRMLEIVFDQGEAGAGLIEQIADDPVSGGILLLYGLHPLDLEARLRGALEKAAPLVHAQGGRLELVSVSEGVVELKLHGVTDRARGAAIKARIDAEIYAAAPDVVAIRGLEAISGPDFFPLAQLAASGVSVETAR